MPDPRSFRALTFDCYGTLIDWERGLLAILLPWAHQVGLAGAEISPAPAPAPASPSSGLQPAREAPDGPDLRAAPAEARAAEIARPFDPLPERLLAAFAAAEPVRESQGPDGAPGFMLYPQVLRAVMRDIAQTMSVDPDAAPTAAAAEALARSVGDWPPFPDTPAALGALQRRCQLVIVSNVDRASFARTNERLGVAFDAIITAEDVRSYKPNPAHFHRALETLRAMSIERHQVLHVAQSLFHDHVPAKSLGLATCWVRRARGRPDASSGGGGARVTPEAALVRPDFEVETLADLAARFDLA